MLICSLHHSAFAVPATPTTVPRATVNNGAVTITVPAVSGATRYTVYRGTVLTGFSTVACTTGYGNQCVAAGLSNTATYYFKYRSGDATGLSTGMSPATTGFRPSASIPNPPRSLKVSTVTDTSATLKWKVPSGGGTPTGYTLFYSSTPGRIGTSVTVGNVGTYTLSGLTAGTTYYFRLAATNTSGISIATPPPPSLEVTAKTWVRRLIINTKETSDTTYVLNATSGTSRGKQVFLSNMSRLKSVTVLLEGWGSEPSDTITIRVGDSCTSANGTSWPVNFTQTVSLSGRTSPSWVTFQLPTQYAMTYGEYYILEVSTQVSKLGINVNNYSGGRWAWTKAIDTSEKLQGGAFQFQDESHLAQKKQDLMFYLIGAVESSKALNPVASTNRACPSGCELVNTTENAPDGSPANAFNVLIQEARGISHSPKLNGPGSFWTDDMTVLKAAIISKWLEGPNNQHRFGNTKPYSEWYAANKVNFYIARANPDDDPEYLRGFFQCANIDARIFLSTGERTGANSGHSFDGVTPTDPRTSTSSGQLMHETFGHGFGIGGDQNLCANVPCTLATGTNDPTYAFGTTHLGSGTDACSNTNTSAWCTSSKPVTDLIADMSAAADPNQACWTYTAAECTEHDGICYDINGQDFPYFDTYTCVPKTVVHYNIGIGCGEETAGNGCYIGRPYGGTTQVKLDAAQAASVPMQQNHYRESNFHYIGFGQAVEDQFRTLLECVFPSSCTNYDQATCDTFVNKWSGGTGANSRNKKFLKYGQACQDGIFTRR